MDRSEILKELLTGLTEACIYYQTRGLDDYLVEEITQECWLWLCTYNFDKLRNAYENHHLSALLTRYLQNQIRSSNSAFYKRYRRMQALETELDEASQFPAEDIK